MSQRNRKKELEKPLINSEDLEANSTPSSTKPEADEDDNKITHSSIGRVLGLAGKKYHIMLSNVFYYSA